MAASSAAPTLKHGLVAGLFAAACLGLALPAPAQDVLPHARLNIDYRAITPQPVPPGNRIEVIEFFWYGCPYCYALQPHLDAWLQRKPPDVVFRYIPAIFRNSWVPAARIYYTLKALGDVGRLQESVYRGYHVERLNLDEPEAAADWAVRQGIDRDQWLAAYNSSAVDREVDQAQELTRRYDVTGTPSVVVDGQYLTSTGMTPAVAAVIPVLDELVALAREQRALQ